MSNYNDGGLGAASPHFNDWDETKKYLAMLFVPGRPVQARELSQLQTMLQVQVDRFGSHIFKNGSPVAGGMTTVSKGVSYVRLDPDASSDNITDYSTLKGSLLTEVATGVTAKVIHVDTTVTTADPYPVIFVEYVAASTDGLTLTFSDASALTSGSDAVEVITSVQTTALGVTLGATAYSNGVSYLVSIDQGIFFVDGFFSLVDQHSYALVTTTNGVRTYTSTPTARVGITATKSTVDIGTDSSLGDPANGSSNKSAPGAHRLKFLLELTQKTFVAGTSTIANAADTDFVELLRIAAGEVRKQIKYPIYSDLEDTLARRTYDESGNYTVRAFKPTARNSKHRRTLYIPLVVEGSAFTAGEIVNATQGSSSSSSGGAQASGTVVSWDATGKLLVVDIDGTTEFVPNDYVLNADIDTAGFVQTVTTEHVDLGLEPGKAYIFGREHETIATEYITVEKPRTTESIANTKIVSETGNYFVVDEIDGSFDINNQEVVYFYSNDNSSSSSSSGSASDIGEARIQNIVWDGTSYRFYIFDFQLYSTNDLASIANIERIQSSGSSAIARIDDTNGKTSGSTVLYEKEKNRLLYPLSANDLPIVADSISNLSYYYRALFTGTFGTNEAVINVSSLTSASNDTLYPHTDTTSSTLADNRIRYTVINTTSNTDVTANITSVVTTSSAAIATIAGSSGFTSGNSYAIYATLESNTQRRTKTLVSSYVMPTIYATIDSVINLGVSDVNSIVSVLDTGDSNADVTSSFEFHNGQTDNLYDHATLTLKPGGSEVGPYQVTCDYFVHSGIGPLTLDSYIDGGVAYADIPTYVSTNNGRSYDLRKTVDARPLRANQYDASSSSSSGTPLDILQIRTPLPYTNDTSTNENRISIDYDVYVGRIDKMILTKSKEFKVIAGNAALSPKTPHDNPDSMTLHKVHLPPYIFDASNIRFDYVENRRYTMKDIGKLDKRIGGLEYYTSLSLLEKDADQLLVRDVNGLDRFKNGILVDGFTGHKIGDVANPDYTCAIDFRNNTLRPPFISDSVSLDYQSGSSTGVEEVGSLITLTSGSTDPLIEQPLASSAISVNPFNVVSWLGNMILSPESDTWVDTTQRPDVTVNLSGDNDAWEFAENQFQTMGNGFGTEWNDWETIWTGVDVIESSSELTGNTGLDTFADINGLPISHGAPFSINRETIATNQNQTRTGITTTLEADRVTESLGDRIVDVSIVPFMRSKVVTATCSGLKPNTILYPFFDGEDVSANCSPSSIQTDAEGKVTVTFTIPASTFRTGERLFRITDQVNNVVANSNVSAEAIFFAQGMLQTRENTVISTRVPRIVRQSVTQERIVSDITDREFIQAEFDQPWVDPVAQSFLVDGTQYPNGIFLKSADLFFKSKDANIPVQIEIRPSFNGYPHSSKVIPFTTVIKDAGDVNISDSPDPATAATYTTFTFDSYVYLSPGEYHLVVRSNSDDYEVWIAEMGQNQIGTTTRITEQPYAGVLFKSQNASTWTADQSKDLTFRLNRCVFSTTTGGSAVFHNSVSSSFANVAQITSSDIQFANAPLTYEYASTPSAGSLGSYLPTQANKNIELSELMEFSTAGDFIARATMSTTDAAISPVIDTERLSGIIVENIINTSSTGETSPNANLTSGAKARYITRRVTLSSDLGSEDIRVFLTAYKPIEANIKVYYRVVAAEDETPFDERPWVEMSATIGTLNDSLNASDLFEIEFKSTTLDSNLDTTVVYDNFAEIQTYAIKIVLLSSSGSKIPYIRDFRAIAAS